VTGKRSLIEATGRSAWIRATTQGVLGLLGINYLELATGVYSV